MSDINIPLIDPDLSDERCQPIDISFRNISYTVKIKEKEEKKSIRPSKKIKFEQTLLNNVSGIFKAGQLTAIMGASGAGKTTLLNILTGRIESEDVMGSIRANGQPYNF